jgi:hypothetical protein
MRSDGKAKMLDDDLFGMPNGTPITDRLIEASIQWAERIMDRIDSLHSK